MQNCTGWINKNERGIIKSDLRSFTSYDQISFG